MGDVEIHFELTTVERPVQKPLMISKRMIHFFRHPRKSMTNVFGKKNENIVDKVCEPTPFDSLTILKALTTSGQFEKINELLKDSNKTVPNSIELRKITSIADWAELNRSNYSVLKSTTVTIGNNQFNSSDIYISKLQDVSFIGGSDLIYDSRDAVLSDNLTDPKHGPFVNLTAETHVLARHEQALLVDLEDPIETIPEGLFLSSRCSNQPGDWLARILPKVSFFEEHCEDPTIPIIVYWPLPKAHYDHLIRLTRHPIKFCDPDRRIGVERLWVIGLVDRFPKQIFFSGLAKVLETAPAKPGSRLEVRRISSVPAWAKSHQCEITITHERELIPTGLPQCDGSILRGSFYSNEMYLAGLNNVSVVGKSYLIYDEKDNVLYDALTDPDFGPYVHTEIYQNAVLAQDPQALLVPLSDIRTTIPEAFMLSGFGSDQFGHWFAEYLPRLLVFKKHPRYSEIPFLVDWDIPKSHYDFLLRLEKHPVRLIKDTERLKIDRLWVASTATARANHLIKGFTNGPRGGFSPGFLSYAQSRLGKVGKPKRPKRIFVGRPKTGQHRLLLNQTDIYEAIKPLGFEQVFPEELTFAELVRLFQDAEALVLPNSSAINNIIFSDTSIIIVSMQSLAYKWSAGHGLFEAAGYTIHYVLAHDVSENKHDSIRIDPNRVIAKLREVALHLF